MDAPLTCKSSSVDTNIVAKYALKLLKAGGLNPFQSKLILYPVVTFYYLILAFNQAFQLFCLFYVQNLDMVVANGEGTISYVQVS